MTHAAKIIADSISPDNIRIVTMELCYPRLIHAEIMTHRVLSRNAASSRAIPVEKMIKAVTENPYVPSAWGKNQKGMQAGENIYGIEADLAASEWLLARDNAVKSAQQLLALGIHKQLTNRLLEPFQWYTCIVTATEWSNMFHLRNNKDAHPDFQKVMALAQEAFEAHEPKRLNYGEWHLPYIFDEDIETLERDLSGGTFTDEFLTQTRNSALVKISAARCARVSYLTHDGKRDLLEDLALYEKLLQPGHMCFDDETEVLTDAGWRSGLEVTPEDRVFTVDISTQEGRFEKPQKVHRYGHDEIKLYHVCGQQLDLMVTTNHRMVVSSRHKDGTWTTFRFEAASELFGKPRRYLKSARFNPQRGPDGAAEILKHKTETDFMRLLGFFVGDGYAEGGDSLEFHLKKKRKVDYLKSLGFDLRLPKAGNKYRVYEPGIGKWFRENCYTEDREKKFPDWILTITEAAAFALFDGLKNSDGSTKRNTWVYDTTSRFVADMLQALLHVHGKVGSISSRLYDGGTCLRVNVSNRTTPRVETAQKGRSLTYEEKLVPYDGQVWCLTVPTGAFMVRRNGKVAISGNSPFEHPARPMSEGELGMFGRWEVLLDDGSLLSIPGTRDGKWWPQQRARVGLEPGTEILSGRKVVRSKWGAFCGNFNGWVQHRKQIPGEEDILGYRANSK